MRVGDKVKILSLKGNKVGKITEIFKHGEVKYYRVVYQNLGDIFLHTTTERNLLKEIR